MKEGNRQGFLIIFSKENLHNCHAASRTCYYVYVLYAVQYIHFSQHDCIIDLVYRHAHTNIICYAYQVFLGPLPSDFLRVNVSTQQMQEAADRQAAMALQQQYTGATGGYQQQPQHPAYMGKLNVTVAQVKLEKKQS